MAVPSTAQSFQVLISSADSIGGNKNDFRVNILGDLNVNQEYYVRLLAADIQCVNTAGNTASSGQFDHNLTVHANFGQQSVLSSNAQNRSNFLGLFSRTKPAIGHSNISAQPYIRCSRPNLGEVNVQIRDAKTGDLAAPFSGSIGGVTLLVEFIPINYNRVRADIEGYVVPIL
jgi:hypothetical protein